MSVCMRAFLLAVAGMLSGRRATTHWAYCESLAARFPDAAVAAEPIYVRGGSLSTSASVTAGIDLALALIEEDLGRDAALTIARHLVVFLRRPGNEAQFSAQLATRTARREPLRDVQQWIAEHPDANLSADAFAQRASLARACGFGTPEAMRRAFLRALGVGPSEYRRRFQFGFTPSIKEKDADRHPAV